MDEKTILRIVSFVIAVLTAVYPAPLWYIGREDKNKNMIKKYEWKMITGICISVIFYIVSLKV